MAQFSYRAYTARSVVTSGTIVADSREAAVDALYGAGLTPFETREIGSSQAMPARAATAAQPAPAGTARGGVDARRLAAFMDELATLVASGLPLDHAFRIALSAADRGRMGEVARALLQHVLGGAQLSEAMAQRPDVFSAEIRAIVTAGEGAGALGPALRQVADLLKRRLELRSKIVSALVYPCMLVVMSLVSIGIIIAVLLPNLAPVFSDAGLPLPGILATFAAIEDHATALAFAAVGLAIALVMLHLHIRSHAGARRLRDRALLRLPLAGGLLRLRDAAAFTRALGTLVSARAPLMASLQTARALVGNTELGAQYDAVLARVPQGTPVGRAFADTALLPASALSLIVVGEETGQLGAMLLQVAAHIETDLQRRIERMVNLLTPLLTVVVGGGVGALILQVMTAVLSINDLALQ